jgi:hypothetical protein
MEDGSGEGQRSVHATTRLTNDGFLNSLVIDTSTHY